MTTDASPTAAAQPPVGIDLGTTYSVIACIDSAGRPTTIVNHAGELLTPSAVLFDDDGVVVGREAVKGSVLNPGLFAECFKREMGRPAARAKIRGLEVPPEVLSALVLDELRADAERRLGCAVRQVVITVPAFFDETRRRATQEAGRLAGLEVLDIINEPTAAAVAFGCNRGLVDAPSGRAQRILVYDLGGGTFDVTILEIEGNRFRALATDGDVQLGGRDFDERLLDHLAGKFVEAHGVDPRSDPQDAAQLWLDAKEAKHALSERSRTTVSCFHAGIRMRLEVTRSQFEELTRDLIVRTETTASLVVEQAGLRWDQLDRVLLVGGSTRMPAVTEMLERMSGRTPDASQSPDEVVAHGAALYAAMLMHQTGPGRPACDLVNVNSHSLGVVGTNRKTGERLNVVLIPKNTALPCRAVRTFRTAAAGQRTINVPVVEGESHRPEYCISLGQCVLRDLPPGLPQGTPVEVEYAYAANGCISVQARVPSIRQSTHVEIARERLRALGTLDEWRNKLLGRLTPESGTPFVGESGGPRVDLSDRASVLKRLDGLYVQVGRAAAGAILPAALERSRQAAAAAAQEVAAARQRLAAAEQAQQAAGGGPQAVHAGAAAAQTRTELEQAQLRAGFAHLVLGRDAVDAGVNLPGIQRLLMEIRELRRHTG